MMLCFFQDISDRNVENWGQRESIHRTGSKSYSQINYENVISNSKNILYNVNSVLIIT